MKATGVVRRIDQLGHFFIPKEIRKNLNVEDDTSLESFVGGSKIILQKYQPDTWSAGELKEALIAAARDSEKDPLDYLRIQRKEH